MIPALFFTWFGAACLWTVNALRRPVPPTNRFPPLWLPGMLISEFAPWYLVGRAVLAAIFVILGGLDLGIGWAALVLFVLSEIGLVVLIRRSWIAARQVGFEPHLTDLWKVWLALPEGVEATRDLEYSPGLTLDIYRRPGVSSAPALIYLHPGSWMRGRPGRQARPLLFELADMGWVVLDVSYPLSPSATFPEHLLGVRAAIAWAKTEGAGFGIDASKVALSGGSSGAHLAALAALTADLNLGLDNPPSVDLSVVGCAAHYGIFDLLVRNGTRYDWPFVAKHVMKTGPDENPQLYKLGSPIDLVSADAPPFLVVHGEFDSVVLADESRYFVEALANAGGDVRYLEVRGGQHGFDAFPTLRSRAIGRHVAAFLVKVAAADQAETVGELPE